MNSELAPLFEPIVARFETQATAVSRLLADNAALLGRCADADHTISRLSADVQSLRKRLEDANPPPGAAGWTEVPPPPPDARVVHVSAGAGDDANDGLSPAAPLRSIGKAVPLLRDGAGDRLLLRRGDTFRGSFGNWTRSGRSPDHPLVLGAYGEGPRPVVLSGGTAFAVVSGDSLHDVWLVGLHLRAEGRDPLDPAFSPAAPAGHGVRFIRPARNVLIEDCRVEHFANNLTLTAGSGDDVAAGAALVNVRVRRCQVLDAWSDGGAFAGQGLYAYGCHGLLIEECVFDHNGWNERVAGASPNIYRHNLYLGAANRDTAVRGNVIANASSHGVQLRGGGLLEDNLLLDNAIHAFVAGPGALVRRNVFLGGRDISPALPRGYGLTLSCAEGRAEHNVLAHKPAVTGSALTVDRGEWTPPGPQRLTLVGNVVHAWGGNGLEVSDECDTLEFVGNDVQRCDAGRKVLNVKANVRNLRLAANRYDSASTEPARWFWFGGRFVPFDELRALTGDTSRCSRADLPDAGASAADLLPPDYLAAARAQSRQTWDDRLSAKQINRRILERFGK